MKEMLQELERLEAITSNFDESDESKENEWSKAYKKEFELSDRICKDIVKLSNNTISYNSARKILALYRDELISFLS